MCKKLGLLPDYIVLRHGPGALCLSIRDLDRDEVMGGLLALLEFFGQGEPYQEREVLKGNDRLVIHPGRC